MEVGAGNGRLTHFLAERVPSDLVHFVAVDSGEWGIDPAFPKTTPVVEIDQKTAIQKYAPSIIINSWMPYQHDWTAEWRQNPCVEEYILIGDPFVCGDNFRS